MGINTGTITTTPGLSSSSPPLPPTGLFGAPRRASREQSPLTSDAAWHLSSDAAWHLPEHPQYNKQLLFFRFSYFHQSSLFRLIRFRTVKKITTSPLPRGRKGKTKTK